MNVNAFATEERAALMALDWEASNVMRVLQVNQRRSSGGASDEDPEYANAIISNDFSG